MSEKRSFPWRSAGALFFFLSAMAGFSMGVTVTERPDLAAAGMLARAYYSLSLFVVGGLDLGTPTGGPFAWRGLVWLAYFGAPILAASTLIEALLRAIAPRHWRLRPLKNHIIVAGTGGLPRTYLRLLREHDRKVTVVVVGSGTDSSADEEIGEVLGAQLVTGDLAHASCMKKLRVASASMVFLLDDHSLRNYETASKLIRLVPGLKQKIVIHCGDLRFMRAMENTRIAQDCATFNIYQMAASALVRNQLLQHFHASKNKDIVIIAGFGRFGQTIVEELQQSAGDNIDTVAIIELDAYRKVLVADEQLAFADRYRRELFEGDIAYPEVWEHLAREIPIGGDNTVFVLGTGREEENLRTALWLRRQYPDAMVIARSLRPSRYAAEVGDEHDIISISITQLVEENVPRSWVAG